MICKFHKPIFHSQKNGENIPSDISEKTYYCPTKILAHFEFDTSKTFNEVGTRVLVQ